MDDRYSSTPQQSAKDAVRTQPVPPGSHEAGATSTTRNGTVGVYDRPESTPRSWSSMTLILLAVVFIAFVLAVYFFVS
jgi:hypothetical protein